MSILFDLNGVNLVSFQKILAVCLDFLASAGVQKTVSLEYTTDAPTVAGWYWIISQEDRICVREIVDIGSVLHVDVNDGFEQYVSLSLYALRVRRWPGPLPLPPFGEQESIPEYPTFETAKEVMMDFIYQRKHPFTFLGGAVQTYPGRDAERDLKHAACVALHAEDKIAKLSDGDGWVCWGPLPAGTVKGG